ncbi:MAG: hypothetical protein M3411_04700 [Chloroflexota bacterium]|nr:hypothetical protein [Chloroflexota bacterium]
MTGHWNAKQSRRQLLQRGAGAAYFALRRGEQAGWEADVHPRWPLVTMSDEPVSSPR